MKLWDLVSAHLSTPSHDLVSADISTQRQDLVSANLSTPSQDLVSAHLSTPRPSQDLVSAHLSTPSQELVSAHLSTPSQNLVSAHISTPNQDLVSASTPSQDLVSSQLSTHSHDLVSAHLSGLSHDFVPGHLSTPSHDLVSGHLFTPSHDLVSTHLSTPSHDMVSGHISTPSHDLVSGHISNPGNDPAVYYSSSHLLTYSEVASICIAVSQLLHSLHAEGEVVCVHLDENTPEILLYIPVILAIIRTGSAFYFIRDRDRITAEAIRCRSRLIISCHHPPSTHHLITNHGTVSVSILTDNIRHHLPPDTCYLITTSGTTGSSKLVYVTNSSVVPNVIDMKQQFSVSSEDLLFLASPLTFDPHIIDIFVSLSAGARLLILPRTSLTRGDIAKELFITHHVTIMQCTPTMLERVGQGEVGMRTLRVLAVGGEKCSDTARKLLLKLWKQNVAIFHLYGLTEMSVWQVMTRMDTMERLLNPPVYVESENLLSGVVVACGENKEMIVRSEERRCWVGGEEVREVMTGDIGYWDGASLYWEGRKDDIVKIMGKKVSLDRVGDILSRKLSTAVVCVLDHESSVHAFVRGGASDFDTVELLAAARDNLAPHEIPGKFTTITDIPVTHHGKVDKRKLLSLPTKDQESNKDQSANWNPFKRTQPSPSIPDPENSGKNLLSSLWTSVVGSAPSHNDNFVSCGGDSFSAVALVNSLSSKMAVPSTLLETLLTGTYQDLMTLMRRKHSVEIVTETAVVKRLKLKAENIKTKEHQPHSVTKRLKGRPTPWPWPRIVQSDKKSRVVMSTFWTMDMLKCIDSSPLYLHTASQELVVACSHSGKVACVQLSSGSLVWSTDLPDRVEASPTADPAGELLLVGCYDHNLYCLAVDTGHQVWVFPTGGIVKCSPLVMGEMVVFGSYDHRVYRVTTGDGEQMWGTEVGGSVLASPVMVEMTLVIATLSGKLSAVEPVDGRTVWTVQLGHPVFGTPLYTGDTDTGLLVPCDNNTFYSLSAMGSIIWTVTTGGPIFSSPISVQDRILFGCHDGRVYCVSGGGTVLWSTDVGGEVAGALDWNNEGDIVCCTVGGTVHILDWEGGKAASMELGGEVFSSPLIVHDRVVVGSRDNLLYCLQINKDQMDS